MLCSRSLLSLTRTSNSLCCFSLFLSAIMPLSRGRVPAVAAPPLRRPIEVQAHPARRTVEQAPPARRTLAPLQSSHAPPPLVDAPAVSLMELTPEELAEASDHQTDTIMPSTAAAYVGHFKAWQAYLAGARAGEVLLANPYLVGFTLDQQSARIVHYAWHLKTIRLFSRKRVSTFLTGLKTSFETANHPSGAFDGNLVTRSRRAGAKVSATEIRGAALTKDTTKDGLPVPPALIDAVRASHGFARPGATLAQLMVCMGIMYAFNFGCRSGQYTKTDPRNMRAIDGKGDHTVRTCDVTVTFSDGTICAGSPTVRAYCERVPAWHAVRATVEHLTSKASDAFTGIILERTTEEASFLRDLVLFMGMSGAPDGGPLFSFSSLNAKGKEVVVQLLRKHVSEALREGAVAIGIPPSRITPHSLRKGANMCGRLLNVTIEERRESLMWSLTSETPNKHYDDPSLLTPGAMPPSVNTSGHLRGYYAWIRTGEALPGINAEQARGLTLVQLATLVGHPLTPPGGESRARRRGTRSSLAAAGSPEAVTLSKDNPERARLLDFAAGIGAPPTRRLAGDAKA
jgi:hypothetical protein